MKASTPTRHQYTLGEEIAASVTHGIGPALAIAGLVVLVVFAALNGGVRHVVSTAIYGSTLVTLRGAWGWTIFGVIWGLALLGIALETFWVLRPKWLSVVVYVAMGWLIVIATRPLMVSLASPGLWLLFCGGAAYTIGTVFYVCKSVRYMHTIWHLWVIAGSVCHFFAILYYVVP